MKQQIFFFKTGSNSQKNPFIARELERGFADCTARVVGVVKDILKASLGRRVQALAEERFAGSAVGDRLTQGIRADLAPTFA